MIREPIDVEEIVFSDGDLGMQQKWTMAYKQDRSHKTAYNQLRQGKPVDKYYLTPTGLMAMMVGTQQKIIVPQSLR